MKYNIDKCNLKVKSELFRKAVNIQTLLSFTNPKDFKIYNVDYILRLSEEDYIEFTSNFLDNYEFINEMSRLTDKEFIVMKENNDIFIDGGILVAHEGYTYARYSGLILEVI